MNDFKHPIRIVSIRTGLSPHVIRAWERRYKAIVPQRTGTNRRLYSDEEIHRLQLLRRATTAGHGIGQIAGLADDDLQKLVAEDQTYAPQQPPRKTDGANRQSPGAVLESCIDAVSALDAARLEEILSRSMVQFTRPIVIEEIVLPLMSRIGEKWQKGFMKIVHEHVASAVVRNILGNLATSYGSAPSDPCLVVATPAGQIHEFGALAVAATANSMGWRSIYLGPSLPAEEIAAAVESCGARAVALSVVHPAEDPRVGEEIERLRRLVRDDVTIFVGGRAARNFERAGDGAKVVFMSDLGALRSRLESIEPPRDFSRS
jgi:methanogenic corrinoid protein MtbC1